jgi:hypothetical protein
MNGPASSSRATRASSTGARSSTTRSWPRRSWTPCSITRRRSTSRATATGCGRRRRPACSGASPNRPRRSKRRWKPRRDQGTRTSVNREHLSSAFSGQPTPALTTPRSRTPTARCWNPAPSRSPPPTMPTATGHQRCRRPASPADCTARSPRDRAAARGEGRGSHDEPPGRAADRARTFQGGCHPESSRPGRSRVRERRRAPRLSRRAGIFSAASSAREVLTFVPTLQPVRHIACSGTWPRTVSQLRRATPPRGGDAKPRVRTR